MKTNKTNAARMLDQLHIPYALLGYQPDEENLSAVHVAGQLQLPAHQLFKTLLFRGTPSGLFVCLVPGGAEVDLKLAAAASGNKRAEMVPVKELLALTGYVRGGCSPVGMKRSYPTYMDEQCLMYAEIYVSAGKKGIQFKIAPRDLIRATQARLCRLTTASAS